MQKKFVITEDAASLLKKEKLIEGRKPNYFVTASIAAVTNNKATYIKNKAFDDEHYKKMIEAFLKKFGSASRKELDEIVIEKLSILLSDKQKKAKMNNLITAMRTEGRIQNTGSDTRPKWVMSKKEDNKS